jgi:hypothetical protein
MPCAGPRGIQRSAQAAQAVLTVARRQLQRAQAGQAPDAPASILRQLFEQLGATYIKLGQFIGVRKGEGAHFTKYMPLFGILICEEAKVCPASRFKPSPALYLSAHRPSLIPRAPPVASSPTLFPEEYVLEFQKCLDATEPVSFDYIRRTVEKELKLTLVSGRLC